MTENPYTQAPGVSGAGYDSVWDAGYEAGRADTLALTVEQAKGGPKPKMEPISPRNREANLDDFWEGETAWAVKPPCGHRFEIGDPAWSPHHDVEKHDDGAISVVPRPGNSNSILCPTCGWHGYIEHGVWREA